MARIPSPVKTSRILNFYVSLNGNSETDQCSDVSSPRMVSQPYNIKLVFPHHRQPLLSVIMECLLAEHSLLTPPEENQERIITGIKRSNVCLVIRFPIHE